MKLPVKDRDTIPWMTQREIPAIKAALSAWRAMRRCDKAKCAFIREGVAKLDATEECATIHAVRVTSSLEVLAAIDERLRKEAKDAKAKA